MVSDSHAEVFTQCPVHAHVDDATRAERKKTLEGFIKATLAESLVEYLSINAVEITALTDIVRIATLPPAEAN